MKRGLKGAVEDAHLGRSIIVAEYSPMKRGLKVSIPRRTPVRAAAVAEYSPMKRGLKGACRAWRWRAPPRCRVFPDEEGTERRGGLDPLC